MAKKNKEGPVTFCLWCLCDKKNMAEVCEKCHCGVCSACMKQAEMERKQRRKIVGPAYTNCKCQPPNKIYFDKSAIPVEEEEEEEGNDEKEEEKEK